jgi:hypothetical protein
MKPRTLGGIITAVIFGILVAVAMRIDHQKRGQMGREEFLAKQAARFDRHFTKPAPIGIELFVCVLMSGALFGAYELVAFGVSKAFRSTGGNDIR